MESVFLSARSTDVMVLRARAALAVLALLLAASAAPAAVGQAADEPPDDATYFVVEVEPDGDAVWTVSRRFGLATDNDTATFTNLVEEFESTDGATDTVAAFGRAAERAAADTGREMSVGNASYEGTVQEGVGYLNTSFRWTGFARAERSDLIVEDVFNTSEEWFPGLTRDQTLVIEPPAGYAVWDTGSNKPVDNGALRWQGPVDLSPTELRVVYRGAGAVTTPTSTAGPTATPTPTPGGPGAFSGAGPLIGGAVLVAAVTAGAYVLVRRGDLDDDGAPGGASADAGDDGPPPDPPAPSSPADADATANGDGDADAEEDDGGVREELLSDEERVERLLEENGGRMKQARIVKETGWSNAKVSQLLSSMAEEGRVDKLRIGRENLISFPDENVAEFDE